MSNSSISIDSSVNQNNSLSSVFSMDYTWTETVYSYSPISHFHILTLGLLPSGTALVETIVEMVKIPFKLLKLIAAKLKEESPKQSEPQIRQENQLEREQKPPASSNPSNDEEAPNTVIINASKVIINTPSVRNTTETKPTQPQTPSSFSLKQQLNKWKAPVISTVVGGLTEVLFLQQTYQLINDTLYKEGDTSNPIFAGSMYAISTIGATMITAIVSMSTYHYLGGHSK